MKRKTSHSQLHCPLHSVETCERTNILAHNILKTQLLIAFFKSSCQLFVYISKYLREYSFIVSIINKEQICRLYPHGKRHRTSHAKEVTPHRSRRTSVLTEFPPSIQEEETHSQPNQGVRNWPEVQSWECLAFHIT